MKSANEVVDGSRSDRMMVAVAFRPRNQCDENIRRVATAENDCTQASLRDADLPVHFRGLKATATIRARSASILIVVASFTLLTTLAHAFSIPRLVIDSVVAGDEADERDHRMKGEQTSTQLGNYLVRLADTNGWFSWELKVLPDTPQELTVQFNGGNRRSPDTVNILVDDTRLGTVRLAGGAREEYYALTTNLLKGRSAVTLRFQAATNSRISGVLGASITTLPSPTIASTSKASSPRTNYQFIVNAVNDQREPKSSGDRFKKHFDWWPIKGTNAWVQYDFAKPARVSAVEVYWFDDTGIGECRLPKGWRVLYRDRGEWKPVTHASGYGCEGNRYNRTTFDAVEADGLQLDVECPERFSSGVLQWKVEAAK